MDFNKHTPLSQHNSDLPQTVVIRVPATRPGKTRQPAPPAHERNFGLDLMRFMAIMLVMIDHGSYLYYSAIPQFLGNNLSLTGHWGVQIFFVLSGFLIGRILIKEVMLKEFRVANVINFWKRRWFRTLPNYLLFLAIFTVIALAVPAGPLASSSWNKAFELQQVKHLAYYPFCLQNFLVTDITFMGHGWSLAVEEWFYLLTPCMLFPVLYFNKRGSLKNRLLLCFSALAIGFMLLRSGGVAQAWNGYTRLAVIYNLDNLMVGVIVAWLFTYYKTEVLSRKKLLMAVSALLFATGFFLQNKFILTGRPREIWEAVIIPMQTIAFACALPWFYDIRLTRTTWMSRIISKVSAVSYSMYLVHFIVLVFVIDTIQYRFHIQSGPGSFALFGFFIGLTVWVSALNYRYFEQPMTALRDKVSRK